MEDLIQHINSIVKISESKLSVILSKLIEKRFHKKEHLLYANDYAKEVFFIANGCTRTYILDFNGMEHNIAFSTETWWFGDLQSFIKKTPATFNIQALENTTVLAISQENWDALLTEIPEFTIYTRTLFRNTMFALENRISQNLSFTAEERYRFFLQKYPQLAQRIPQKHIASYLGITPEFLSMIRSKRK